MTPITRNEHACVETPVDDELIVMNIDTGSFHSFKGSGKAIWMLINGQRDCAAIADALVAIYDVGAAEIQAEVASFIEGLREVGLVHG